MATGMISLLVFIVYANFVPSCKKSTGALSHLAPVEQITPQVRSTTPITLRSCVRECAYMFMIENRGWQLQL